ncbi:MAG TPA: PQQ-dependent sugar dehydrogenase [Gaiellaceae bacterium]|nr:PQQ-dependent sugar dehydrogenase [Gaiellaceae bacterium]
MRRILVAGALCALVATCTAGATQQQAAQAAFKPRAVASGFSEPLYVTGAKGEPGRLYVVEQGGRIRVLQNGKRRAAPFLDIRRLVTAGGEQGLLGLAFHPSYPKVAKLYVQYTAGGGSTRVVEYRTNGTRAFSPRLLFSSRDPYGNHNGGMLAFGPNGRLFFTMGDGGSGGDPQNRAQNPRSLFGKLLSLNVATKGLKVEAIGLRNAWRFSFDRANGDLYIGDVGQNSIEEVDYMPADSAGVQNYGWDVYEGRSKYEDKAPGPGNLVFPVAQYSHDAGCSVTGGYVYRGSNVSLQGRYIYGDYCTGVIWSFKIAGGKADDLREEPFTIRNLASFGEDTAGELYAVSQGGTVYRLTP